MKLPGYLLIVVLYTNISFLHSQISDDFTDYDFSHNPEWIGDADYFAVSPDHELQLNSTIGGEAYLALPHTIISEDILEWRFKIRLAFSPSGNNFARIYLSSNHTDLKSADLKGYYLQFGENLSNDAIELFYQENGASHSVCRGINGFIANAFTHTILVQKDLMGNWRIYVQNETGIYDLHTQGSSDFFPLNVAIGVYCKFTASNGTKFFFDDFYLGPPIVDTVRPEIVSVSPGADDRKIEVCFSERVHPVLALLPQNYLILEGALSPLSCEFESGNHQKVILTFASSFEGRVNYQLAVSNIQDLAGNVIVPCSYPVFFFTIKRNEVVIHEIMADPSPPVALPNCEYVEIKNRTSFPLRLTGWKLKIGSSTKNLPVISLAPGGFVVVVPLSCLPEFSSFENVIAVSSLSIADAGQRLTLYNEHDEVIHSVEFKQNWHQTRLKQAGGWSLEMMDPDNPCAGSENWNSSVSELGGTPGFQNSIQRTNRDIHSPEISKLTVPDSITLRLFFTESVFLDTSRVRRLFEIDHDIKVLQVEEIPPDFKSLRIKISKSLQEKIIYTLTLTDTICDCVGLPGLLGSFVFFGLPLRAFPGDLIINEILSNPFGSDDADFVEIYNRSDKIIDLKTVKIGSGKGEFPDKAIMAVSDGYNLFPGSYVALCKNKPLTCQQYDCPYPDNLLGCDSLPNFPNESGGVHLLDIYNTHLDRLYYDPSMHYSMLASLDGVSLERIHFDAETQEAANWKSAAAGTGFATPGYKNSQFSELVDSRDILQVIPEIFSPDNDGFDDFVEMYCHFPETENRVTISIFDRHGNLVKILANNQLCGTEERFLWDGLSDKGMLVLPGIYIIKMHSWNENGKVRNVKKSVGVAFRN